MHRRALAAVLLPAALLSGACSADEEEPEQVGQADEGEEQTEDTAAEAETFAVGDIVALGDYEVTVHGVQDPLPPASTFITAPTGNHYVGLDVEVRNSTDEPQTFSGLLAFELQDAENRTYDLTFTDHQPAAPDGELPPQGAKRGLAVFSVPDGAAGLRLLFAGDVFAGGTATVNLT